MSITYEELMTVYKARRKLDNLGRDWCRVFGHLSLDGLKGHLHFSKAVLQWPCEDVGRLIAACSAIGYSIFDITDFDALELVHRGENTTQDTKGEYKDELGNSYCVPLYYRA